MSYLKSNQVHVFPFGSTRKVNPTARVMNEQNISQLVRNLTDLYNYVIDYDQSNMIMRFCIYGYYFKVDLKTVYEEGKPLYAYIVISSIDGYEYLVGGDQDGINVDPGNATFTGINFVTSYEDIPADTMYLHILDESGNVPKDSYKRFSAQSIGVDEDFFDQLKIDRIYCGNASYLVD